MHATGQRRLLATFCVGLTVFGGTVALLRPAGPLGAGAALTGLGAAATLTVALLVMVWARRRAEAPPPGPGARPGLPGGGGRAPVLVPLGNGCAAVIFDEPAVAEAPGPDRATLRRDACRATDAIWAAVDAAVDDAAGPPPPPAADPSG